MASQLALVFAKQLGVPVLITDLSEAKVDGALGWIAAHLEKLVNRGQLSETAARDLGSLVRGTVDKREYRDCDVVIEAVFEELAVKRAVFAEIEPLLRTDALLLTNTSSLSVTAMGHGLAHPERLMGLHFFNPVAVLPLVEIISTENNDDVTRRHRLFACPASGQDCGPGNGHAGLCGEPDPDPAVLRTAAGH